MKIGVIADGKSEVLSLPSLFSKRGTHFKVLRADLQPLAPPKQIAKQAENQALILQARGYSKIVILVDRENLTCCPGDRAEDIRNAVKQILGLSVEVVVKDRKYENWLISDPQSIKRQLPSRFKPTVKQIRQVVPNKADHVTDAEKWLNGAAVGKEYHKTKDVKQIASAIDITEAGRNSRSLRRLLRVFGHPDYKNQSATPKMP